MRCVERRAFALSFLLSASGHDGGLVDLVALEVAAMDRAHLRVPAVVLAYLRSGVVPGDGDGLGGQVIDEALGEGGLQVLDGALVVLLGEVGGVDVLGLALLDCLLQVSDDVVYLLGHLVVVGVDVTVCLLVMSLDRYGVGVVCLAFTRAQSSGAVFEGWLELGSRSM